MKNFKAKLASIHEDLELRKSLKTEEDKNIEFKPQDSVLEAAYTFIKSTIKNFDQAWYDNNPEGDPVNDLMGALKQVADLIESRYTNTPRKTFFNAAEDRHTSSEIGGRGTITIIDSEDGERKLLISMSDPDGVPDTKYGGIDFKNLSTGETVTSNERIRAQLERALRFELGFDVTSAATNASREAGGGLTEVGQWKVSILWNKEKAQALEVGNTWEFKLVPESIPKQ